MKATATGQLEPEKFRRQVLDWFDLHGRQDLPWQRDINPYRVWVSEIMLQQTQVGTVIPYFQRFMAALPSVQALAAAPEDQVLHLWAGLGYYARARNLHKTARQVCERCGGEFPATVEALASLPGIGRSTAGAIRSIAFGQPAAILDGNVKRVLARYCAIGGWPGQATVLKQLWGVAEQLSPTDRVGDYSQAMMDLGATLCSRSRPACGDCPLSADCAARTQDRVDDYPGRKPRKALPVKSTVFLMARNAAGEIWLERRPGSGIWGGLWCFPEIADAGEARHWCLDKLGAEPLQECSWEPFRHTFSHYHLDIQPVALRVPGTVEGIMEGDRQLWYNVRQPPSIGLAAPVATLLGRLAEQTHSDAGSN